VLGHLARELSAAEKEIGSEGGFGSEDILIPGQRDYVRLQAERYLRSYFPTAPDFDLDLLLNCPIHSRNAGYILQKRGAPIESVFLVVNGVAEAIESDNQLHRTLSAGTILGESIMMGETVAGQTWRAKSCINVLEMPQELCVAFVKRNANLDRIRLFVTVTAFLASTRLFGEMVSSPVLNRIAREVTMRHFKAGQTVEEPEHPSLGLVHSGSLELRIDGQPVDRAGPGDFFGEESIFFSGGSLISACALEDCECWFIAGKTLREVPIIEWKMLETYERRLTSYGNAIL
jgi:hemerythrin